MDCQNDAKQLVQRQISKNPRCEDVFDQLREAQNRYHECCRAFQVAAENRGEAERNLQELSKKAEHAIVSALQDPTVPQCAEAPSNGRY